LTITAKCRKFDLFYLLMAQKCAINIFYSCADERRHSMQRVLNIWL